MNTGRRAEFDPVRVGQRECAAWAAYYRREWMAFLRSAVGMVAAGFGMGPRGTLAGAWHVLQANRAWAPYPANEPAVARAHMRRFYEIVTASGWGPLDPTTAADLEVQWWAAHRAHQHGESGEQLLLDALGRLYAHVCGVPAGTMRDSARLRVEPMGHSDGWVGGGCRIDDPLPAAERRCLVASCTALRNRMSATRASSDRPMSLFRAAAKPGLIAGARVIRRSSAWGSCLVG